MHLRTGAGRSATKRKANGGLGRTNIPGWKGKFMRMSQAL